MSPFEQPCYRGESLPYDRVIVFSIFSPRKRGREKRECTVPKVTLSDLLIICCCKNFIYYLFCTVGEFIICATKFTFLLFSIASFLHGFAFERSNKNSDIFYDFIS